MSIWKKSLALGACVMLSLAACSQDGSSDEAAEPTVDEALLDTGDNPTTPQEPFGKVEEDNVLDFETQRMAEYVSLPYEIDPELSVRASSPIQNIRSAVQADGTYTGAAIYKGNDMLYGFMGFGETPANTAEDKPTQKELKHQVTRFAAPDGPVSTADGLVQYYLTGEPPEGADVASMAPDNPELGDPPVEPATVEEVPGHPDTRAFSRQSFDEGKIEVRAYTPHGDYLFSDTLTVAPEQKQWALETLAHSVDVQGPMIDQFLGIETKMNPRPEGSPEVDKTVDQDHILIYTIPSDEDSANLNGAGRAVYGPRGYSHLTEFQEPVFEALTEAGVENVAVWGTEVMRAAGEDKAKTLLDQLIRIETDGGAKVKESPAGLPTAKCISDAMDFGIANQCYIRNGRYIAVSSALDDMKKAHQDISAEYKILQQADQNA
ncbi:DUF7373 family lipoprotein [Dietzia sp.]|uniref:DUF7373 family lipoprotein n=1 Tax=Dietzia sp. TaxID=1871616 RepID=UPI002FD9254C